MAALPKIPKHWGTLRKPWGLVVFQAPSLPQPYPTLSPSRISRRYRVMCSSLTTK